MNSNARVLVVSRDEMVLRTRVMILGAFFQVEGAGRVGEAAALMNANNFDLVVVCHSISGDDSERLVKLAHEKNPRPLILATTASSRATVQPWADKQLGVDAGPYGLVKKCAEMLGYTLKSKARAAHV
jgi:DNA-binding NtrC family response regulator